MPRSAQKRYTARICWNSEQWRFPLGEARHLEKGGYVVESGFGHEEWLFNFAWLINGYHYAFLQPVNKSFDNVSGTTIDVLVYTINPNSDRLYAGEISRCEVLQPFQADEALAIYRKRGWLKSMVEQVGEIGGRIGDLRSPHGATHLFNIRFRLDDVHVYDPLVRAGRHDAIWKRQRYTLAAASDEVARQWQSRKGKVTPPLIGTVTRKGTPAVTYDPLHARLQGDLFKLFECRYGKGNVILEADNVDMCLRR